MKANTELVSIHTLKVQIRPESMGDFVRWQAKLHEAIALFSGFLSLEISSTEEGANAYWLIVQRFKNSESTAAWMASDARKVLVADIRNMLPSNQPECLQERVDDSEVFETGVIEVFVTQVSPDKEKAYRQWLAKIHQAEAQFPGFRGLYVKAPQQGRNWITFLRFDNQENLNRWLASPEREQVLSEAKPLIEAMESHRVISPYAGWFDSVTTAGEPPSVWKQSMLVLLVLFPIVMLELKYLPILTGGFNPSLATFIGNALSVALISWPMMPIVLFFLGWWLVPQKERETWQTLRGAGIIVALYLIEIAVFWNLL